MHKFLGLVQTSRFSCAKLNSRVKYRKGTMFHQLGTTDELGAAELHNSSTASFQISNFSCAELLA